MNSKFPFSMENIPRQRSFACFSLKFGSILSGLVTILYSLLVIATCGALLSAYKVEQNTSDQNKEDSWPIAYILTVGVGVTHIMTLFLSAVMLVGVLKEKHRLIRPWVVWVSIQVMVTMLMFVMWTTMNMINHFNDAFLIDFVSELVILLIRFYMVMVVGSYFKQLVEERGESERLVTLMNNENWYTA